MPTINFSIDETTSANAQAAATALRSLTQEYQKLNRVLVKTEKQLLKFDEINRLVAYADKPASAGRASSGRASSSKSSTKTSTPKTSTGTGEKKPYTPSDRDTSASLPLHLAIRDIFFEWGDLNWEVILMKLIAGVNAIGLGAIGLVAAGSAGLALGVAAGLLFSILADATIFNFDGKVQPEELRKVVRTIAPAPKIFMDAFDKGIEHFIEPLAEGHRNNFMNSLKEFEDAARKAVLGEPLGETSPGDGKLSEKKLLEMRTSFSILLVYYGFDAASRVHDSVGAQQAEFTIQVHMLLFQANYTAFRSTMTYNEYQNRLKNHYAEKERFDRYDAESKGDIAGESDLVKSLIDKLKKQ